MGNLLKPPTAPVRLT